MRTLPFSTKRPPGAGAFAEKAPGTAATAAAAAVVVSRVRLFSSIVLPPMLNIDEQKLLRLESRGFERRLPDGELLLHVSRERLGCGGACGETLSQHGLLHRRFCKYGHHLLVHA